jgi:hypothetical protein
MSDHGQRARDILEIVAWVGMLITVLIVVSALMPGLHELADRWRRVKKVVRHKKHQGSHRLNPVPTTVAEVEGSDGRVGAGDPKVADSPSDSGPDPQDEEVKA